jgi:hypothetical protein
MANDVPISAGIGTNVETLQQADADLSHRQVVHVGDWKQAIEYALEALLKPMHVNENEQVRVSIEAIAGSLTISTITTVGTVSTVTSVTTVSTVASLTNQAQLGGNLADSMVWDNMMNTWANCMRGRIV